MSDVIESRNYALEKIGFVKKPADLFSGDILLSALSPKGDVNVLLGDFTGHGLRSSIGAIPLAETFRAMTKKGFSLTEIISQINQQLYHLLPPDLFLAAGFVSISSHDQSVYVFNAGLPDTYIFNGLGDIKHKVPSCHPPMGVLPSLITDIGLTVLSVDNSDRVVLISDGIVEARNEAGEMFEFERFEQAAKLGVIQQNVSKVVLKKVNEFCQNMSQEDDISLIDLPCEGWQKNITVNQLHASDIDENGVLDNNSLEPAWRWVLNLTGERLAKVNPIPMAMNQIQEIEGHAEHWQNLFTILTELFINALDHGVLDLSSELKNSAEGFAEYFSEREKRLKNLSTGFVDIGITYFETKTGGKVTVSIKDSGNGFDYKQYSLQVKNGGEQFDQLSGRGIELVTKLCDSLFYLEDGNFVEASYSWHN